MISMYEIHVNTKHTISDILNHLKSKGIVADYRMCKDGHGKLKVKHPQTNTIHTFAVKLYDELGDINEYEFGAWSEPEFNYLKELVKDL